MTKLEQDIVGEDAPTAGDDLTIVCTVTKSDGSTKDLGGAQITWGFADAPGSTPVLTKSTGGGGVTITDPGGGKFEVELTSSETDGNAGRWYHEAEVDDGAGSNATVFRGRFQIRPDTV